MGRMAGEGWTIGRLEALIASLPAADRDDFERIFAVTASAGRLVVPEQMRSWMLAQFESMEQVVEQHIVRLTNRVTLDEAVFNALRASRPLPPPVAPPATPIADDAFADPLAMTPEDTFGRVRGEFCVTASNVAKAEGWHGLVVFDERDPLRWRREQVLDYLETGRRWMARAREEDPEARYGVFIWNCLWRAGASIVHGHAQVLLARDRHYGRIERLRRDATQYRAERGRDYFEDLYRAHRAVGCATERAGVRVLASLTPARQHEVMLLSGEDSPELAGTVYDVLSALRDRMGVTSFNLAVCSPPPSAGEPEGWRGFPTIARVLDRGDPTSQTSDFGAMEIYAASVISSDPLRLARVLREEITD